MFNIGKRRTREIEELRSELEFTNKIHHEIVANKDGEIYDLKRTTEMMMDEAVNIQKERILARKAVRDAATALIELGASLDTVYNIVAPVLDKEGWELYRTCEAMLSVNVYSEYYPEDCMGTFEEMTGLGLLRYAEVAAFGSREYKAEGSYEFVTGMHLDKDNPDYVAYRENLLTETLGKLLKKEVTVNV